MHTLAQTIGWLWVALNGLGILFAVWNSIQSGYLGTLPFSILSLAVVSLPGIALIIWGRSVNYAN